MSYFNKWEAILRNSFKPYDPIPSSYPWAFPNLANVPVQELDQLAADGKFPVLSDLAGCIIYCIFFGVLRLILQRYAIKPLATLCMDLSFSEEKSFGINSYEKKCIKMTKEEVKAFCLQHNLNEKEVKRDIWNRKRNAISNKKFVKFTEASWRFLFYSTFVILGYRTLYTPETAPYVQDLNHLWIGFPQETTSLMESYYVVELGCYMHQLMWTEVHRSDAWEMILHHIVTIVLLFSSYMQGLHRVGVVVLFIHDIADIPLELGKCFNYTAKTPRFKAWAQPTTDTFFAIFAITFFVTRLVIYPQVIYSYLTSPRILGGVWPFYYVSGTLLCTLQCLHVFWFSLIVRMVYKLIVSGGIAKDERSDHESDIGDFETEGCNSEATKEWKKVK